MRALAASDVHGNHRVYEWLARKAQERRVDFILLAGDLLGCPGEYDSVEAGQAADAGAIFEILSSAELPVYFIMGNDDLVELNPGPDHFHALQGRRIEIGAGFNLVGYQYSLPFMGGVFEKDEASIQRDLIPLAASVDDRTIFVSHSPAFGILDLGIMDAHAGSHAIHDLIYRRSVRAHIHGHIHGSFGQSGRHFNVASGGLCRAMSIDFNTLEAGIERE